MQNTYFNDKKIDSRKLFAASCISLMVTSMLFSIRADVLHAIGLDLRLSNELVGLTISSAFWGFTLGMIFCAITVDFIGMKKLHILSGGGYILGISLILFPTINTTNEETNSVFGSASTTLIYIGFLIIGIAQGVVEGVVNPLVATLFNKSKREMLLKLHAWWPLGLIAGGVISWGMGRLGFGWQIKLAVILIPVTVYITIILKLKYPNSERINELISNTQMFSQIRQRLFILLFLTMWLTAATELAPAQWFAKIMADIVPESGQNSILFLVYVAGLMFLLRQYASGWILSRVSPFLLLALGALITLVGLVTLASIALLSDDDAGKLIVALIGVTLFGVGKAFFWPTMLAITSELFPKGGAFLINLMGGAGMLSAMIAVPVIGKLIDNFDASRALYGISILPAILILIFTSLWLLSIHAGGYHQIDIRRRTLK